MSPRGKKPRKTVVRLTRRALFDLREISDYSISRWGRSTADKYLDDLAAALDRIHESPELLRQEPSLSPGLYFYRVKKHFLVCDCQRDTVLVLTVVHTSMDIPQRLLEMAPGLAAEAEFLRSKLLDESGRE